MRISQHEPVTGVPTSYLGSPLIIFRGPSIPFTDDLSFWWQNTRIQPPAHTLKR